VASDRAPAHPVITSVANPVIKQMRSLGRRKVRQTERAFLVEGRRLVEEAARHGDIRSLLVREDQPGDWVAALGVDPARVRWVSARAFDAASDVEHNQGVAAVCAMPEPDLHPEAVTRGLVLILDRMRDPGNLGTALRSAAAAGVRTVLTTHGSVDPFAPKVVRAGMGAHFRMSIGALSPELRDALRATGREIVHADAGADLAYTDNRWDRAAALVMGGETEPLSPELDALVTARVAIPMRGGMESLNAGVAASVLLFEAQRQGAI
jgi:TrmH family RNA methyltransferase